VNYSTTFLRGPGSVRMGPREVNASTHLCGARGPIRHGPRELNKCTPLCGARGPVHQGVGFRQIFGHTWPLNLSRTTKLVLQCRLHEKSAPQTNSKAFSWCQTIPSLGWPKPGGLDDTQFLAVQWQFWVFGPWAGPDTPQIPPATWTRGELIFS
jgi:hypothetical protein